MGARGCPFLLISRLLFPSAASRLRIAKRSKPKELCQSIAAACLRSGNGNSAGGRGFGSYRRRAPAGRGT